MFKRHLLLKTIKYELQQILYEQINLQLNTKELRDKCVLTVENYMAREICNDEIYSFNVRCDETNNTLDVIENNGWKLDLEIYFKDIIYLIPKVIHFNIDYYTPL